MNDRAPSLRLDKWLWHARFCRTRAIAQARAASGLIRLNGNRVEKPAARVRVGDTVTVPTAREAVVVKVLALGMRRGPPTEARALYETIEGA